MNHVYYNYKMKVIIPPGDKAMQFVTIFQNLKMKITDANLCF